MDKTTIIKKNDNPSKSSKPNRKRCKEDKYMNKIQRGGSINGTDDDSDDYENGNGQQMNTYQPTHNTIQPQHNRIHFAHDMFIIC